MSLIKNRLSHSATLRLSKAEYYDLRDAAFARSSRSKTDEGVIAMGKWLPGRFSPVRSP
jgi:hypothetical protein